MPVLSRTQLEAAAADVIGILKSIDEFSDARIAVIGGLALWKYIPSGRTTDDVDFMITVDSAPQGVKGKLLALPSTRFIERAQFFFYKTPGGSEIQIDITPDKQSPYVPTAAMKLRDLPAGTVPYISATDLIVFKINSCGLRAQKAKRQTDALDAQALLEKVAPHSSLKLTDTQRHIVEPCIDDVVANGTKSKTWWKERLSLSSKS